MNVALEQIKVRPGSRRQLGVACRGYPFWVVLKVGSKNQATPHMGFGFLLVPLETHPGRVPSLKNRHSPGGYEPYHETADIALSGSARNPGLPMRSHAGGSSAGCLLGGF